MEDAARRATIESLFRDVNERIAETAEHFDAETSSFVCECADPGCIHRIDATLEDYEGVRSDGATFLLAPGHEDQAIERVVADRGRFRIVEKVERSARAVVKRLDPRTA